MLKIFANRVFVTIPRSAGKTQLYIGTANHVIQDFGDLEMVTVVLVQTVNEKSELYFCGQLLLQEAECFNKFWERP